MESYRMYKNDGDQNLPEKIDLCLMMANECSSAKKESELEECLLDLKMLLEGSDDLQKIKEKSWNNLVQLFARQDKYEKMAIFWFNKIMKQQKVATPNMYTLSTMLKPLSNMGDLKSCEDIVKILKDRSQCNVFTYSYFVKACINNGKLEKAIGLLDNMKVMGIEPNHLVYVPILKEAIRTNKLEKGMAVCEMIQSSNLETMQILMAVGSFFLKAGKPEKAIEEFQKLKTKWNLDVISWTCLIQAYIESGQVHKAIQSISEMKQQGITPDSKTFAILIKSCANAKLLKEGEILYDLARRSIIDFPIELSTAIINFHTKCGQPEIAIEEIEKLKKQGKMDAVLWNCLIQAYIELGQVHKAIQSISEMKQQGITPDSKTFAILIKSCANAKLLKEGEILYDLARRSIKDFPIELSTAIINFHTKCGQPEIAIEEIEKLKKQGKMDIVSWNCLIQAYIESGQVHKAIEYVHDIEKYGIQLDCTLFATLMQACTKHRLIAEGKNLHKVAMSTLKTISVQLYASICVFYFKCGQPEIAIEEIEKLKKQGKMDAVLWNCLIQAYVELDTNRAFELFYEMQEVNKVKPDSITFTILITACANAKLLKEGEMLYDLARRSIRDFPIELSTAIINFHTKCGQPEIAIEEIEKLKKQGEMDAVLWNCLIQAYVELDINRAIELFYEMQEVNKVKPDSGVFTILITACANAKLLKEGEMLYDLARRNIRDFPIELSTSIINFHTKCGQPEIAIEEIEKLQKQGNINLALWNCLIQAYVELDTNRAFELFYEMQEVNKMKPDSITFTILITACANAKLLKEGEILYDLARRSIIDFPIELSTAIINFHTKCGQPEIAIEEIEKLKKQGKMDAVLWNCLIQAYIKKEDIDRAVEEYIIMKELCEPDIVIYIVLLSACAEFVSVDKGNFIIGEIKRKKLDTNEDIKSVMVMFYSKIGDNKTAQHLFDDLLKERKSDHPLSLTSYNNMLATFAVHGKANQAKTLYEEILAKNIQINDQTFTNVLSAFSHSGMVDEAETVFKTITNPSIYNIGAMVDVYARAGAFDKAESLIGDREHFVLWNTVMSGCRKYNNIELGEKVYKILTSIDSKQSSPYLLMSHIYTYHGLNQKADQIRDIMTLNGIKKIPGIVFHEENGKTYRFISGASKSEKYVDLVKKRDEIYRKIIRAGFQPDTRWVTNAKLLTEQEKIDSLCKHAEKTAIAHAFLLNPNRKEIILRNNLRVCNDCHNATEFISKVMNVEIIMRDANRYHHFKDGKCSCNGYW